MKLLLSNVTFIVMLHVLATEGFLNKRGFRFLRRMSESESSEFQTWDNDPQASVLDRAENMSLLIISNGYIY